MKRGNYVVCKTSPNGPAGLVRRVAKDGTWADVYWRGEYSTFDSGTKRVKTEALDRVDENE